MFVFPDTQEHNSFPNKDFRQLNIQWILVNMSTVPLLILFVYSFLVIPIYIKTLVCLIFVVLLLFLCV